MGSQGKYYEYWALTKPPFDNVPDPEMYFGKHTSVGTAVAETLFAIEEGNECLAVIVGDVGLGKTLALRVIIASLKQENSCIALITNPDATFMQLMQEILGQLSGEPCTESRREYLLEALRQRLHTIRETGRKAVICIDEANAIKSATLESLRLLTNMQSGEENLFTIILAGQLELARRLEHPRRANLFQRIGVYCHLHKIESRHLVREYVEHRLTRAGARQRIFTDAAYDAIWIYSDYGVPRLINKVTKLALKAGQTQQLPMIDETVVRQIGTRFNRLLMPPSLERRERERQATSVGLENPALAASGATEIPLKVTLASTSLDPASQLPTVGEQSRKEQPFVIAQAGDEQTSPIVVADVIKFPHHIYNRARAMPQEQRLRFAGQLAVEVLRKFPHLIQQLGTDHDPVPAWSIVRNVIMRQMEQRFTSEGVSAAQPSGRDERRS